MNIRSNRYNDPALGEAFNNIASIFAPPSAQDLAGYATAAAKKQEREQMAWMFENAMDPLASARSAVTGVQSFGNTPAGFGMTDATNRRGQDITASTSITNNTADNARALTTNAADNERAVATNLTDNQFRIGGQFMTPLNPGQVQPGLPATLADMYGLPELPRTEGLPKPLSLDETKALTYGRMDPALQEAMTFGSTPIEQILQDDGTAMNVTALDALGQTPVPPSQGSQAAPDVQNYRAPDGTSGTAVYRDGTGWVDTQTNQPIPQGSLTMKANATGTADEALGTNSNITLGQRTVALADYAGSRAAAYQEFLAANPGVAGVPGMLTGFAQDLGAGLKELAAAYGDQAVPMEAVTGLTEQITGGGAYKPEVREALNRAAELAYLQAQLGDPGGEVNVREWERLYGQFIGNLGGNAAVAGPLRAFLEQVDARRIYGNNLINGNQIPYPSAAPAPRGPAVGEVVEGHRFLGGDPAQQSSWEKVQ